MRGHLSVLRTIVFGITVTGAYAAFAQEATFKAPGEAGNWGVGIGVGVEQSPYRDFGNKSTVLPLLFYQGDRLRLQGTTADFKLGSVSNVDFTVRAKYANDGYKSGDASSLNGMEERKRDFWVGGTAVWHAPVAKLTLELLKDASGNSNGKTVRLGAERSFSSGRFRFTPYLGVAWVDSNYVDYYYGVRQSEVTASRSAYLGKSTVNTSLGLRTDYSLTPTQSLLLDLSVLHYGSGVTDSPIVERSTSTALRLGYVYKF